MKYDYILNIVTIEGTDHDMDDYRRWLIDNHNQLCSGHFIKAIRKGDKTVFTFDWQSIFLKADEYGISKQYNEEILRVRSL
jgi:hypothetical protein